MITTGAQLTPVLVLASQSQQRLALLNQVGFAPLCLPADVDETPRADESPAELVMRLACTKAVACRERPDFSNKLISVQENAPAHEAVILAADTVIDVDGQSLGKPCDEADAIAMLLHLSGREHLVHSGVCVQTPTGEQYNELVTTVVRFASLTRSMALRYWNSGEPQGKAGSYAIQGAGAQFVVHLSGSYSNVVGLPLYETTRLLAQAGLVQP